MIWFLCRKGQQPMKKLKWGVLSTANIGVAKVIPAMQCNARCEVVALAGRDFDRARNWADRLGIRKAYGSYAELLEDDEIEAVYNPLPNHLHVPWTLKAIEAGKHVLCEKPLALSADEAASLNDASVAHKRLVLEAFMVRHHPQWLRSRELIRSGVLGRIQGVQGVFAYCNTDPQNIRNQPDIGGGGLMDIGSYCVMASRYVFAAEPLRVVALMDRDPAMGIDRLTSCLLDYGSGRQASFICGTQTSFSQGFRVFGELGGIQLAQPFKSLPEETVSLILHRGENQQVEETFPPCNQYTLQADTVSRVFSGEIKPEFSLQDAILNMRVIDAVRLSADSGGWVKLAGGR